MKITRLTAENIKRLVAVSIEPDGSVITLGGKNGAGKSSVLDSIQYALADKRSQCKEPVRRGSKKGSVVVELDNGLVVKRTLTPGGGGSLVVSPKDGARYETPQAILDGLVGKLTFDPLAFLRLKPKAQADAAKELLGLDFSELEADRASSYEDRTLLGRRIKVLEIEVSKLPEYSDEELVDRSTVLLIDALEAANDYHRKIDLLEAKVFDMAAEQKRAEQLVERLSLELEQAKDSFADASADFYQAQFQLKRYKENNQPQDVNVVKKQIFEVEEHNRKAAKLRSLVKYEKELKDSKDAYSQLTQHLQSIDTRKAEVIAAAKFPVQGLSFSEEGLMLNNLPIEQASSAEQLKVSVAMGIAANPELKVLLIRDGSLLDAESMATISQMAEEADAQVWIERVGEGGCQVVIEDGQVK